MRFANESGAVFGKQTQKRARHDATQVGRISLGCFEIFSGRYRAQ
jgi:hypothetical protein